MRDSFISMTKQVPMAIIALIYFRSREGRCCIYMPPVVE